jgi:hypothetical protein
MFKLEFSIDNAAFADNPGAEIARILRGIAVQVEAHGPDVRPISIRDINGNVVGSYGVEIPDEPKLIFESPLFKVTDHGAEIGVQVEFCAADEPGGDAGSSGSKWFIDAARRQLLDELTRYAMDRTGTHGLLIQRTGIYPVKRT